MFMYNNNDVKHFNKKNKKLQWTQSIFGIEQNHPYTQM